MSDNTDRAQIEALGKGGARVIDQAEREKMSRWELIEATSPSGKMQFRCKVCDRISPTPDKLCNLFSGYRPCREEWDLYLARQRIEYLSSFLEEAAHAAAQGVNPAQYLATKAPTTLRDWIAELEAKVLKLEAEVRAQAAAADQYLRAWMYEQIAIKRIADAVLAWWNADTTHEGEDALHDAVLRLAGAALDRQGHAVGIDIDRLVDVMVDLFDQKGIPDEYIDAYLAGCQGQDRLSIRSGARAVALAALGLNIPTTHA